MNFRHILFAAALLVSFPAHSATFNTFAAWTDSSSVNRGYIFVYTGASGANVELFDANAPNVTIANSIAGPVATGAYEPVIAYGPIVMSSNQKYFRLQTNNPVVWEIEEDLQNFVEPQLYRREWLNFVFH